MRVRFSLAPSSSSNPLPESFGLFAVGVRITAKSPLSFAPGEAANRIRGLWGKSLYGGPLYHRLFSPPRKDEGPGGRKDPPRPFVLRTRHLDGRSFAVGEEIPFRAHIFDRKLVPLRTQELRFSLASPNRPVERVAVEFLTPTDLKGDTGAGFATLFARLRDRISTLRALYGEGPLGIDFRAMGERAASVRLVAQSLHSVERERKSFRTGQTHPLGGFIGEAIYEGDLTEFLPYLELGAWVGVGRQTVWGNGELHVRPLA